MPDSKLDPVSKANGVFIGGRLQAARRWSGGGRFICQSKSMRESHEGRGGGELERRPVPSKFGMSRRLGQRRRKIEVPQTGTSDPASTSLGNFAVMGLNVVKPAQYRQQTRRTLRVTRRVLRVCSNLKRLFCAELHLSHLSREPWVLRCGCLPLRP